MLKIKLLQEKWFQEQPEESYSNWCEKLVHWWQYCMG
jgi:hypothetical protein